jgi:uncharacterized protein YoaH (UPF0181 family)
MNDDMAVGAVQELFKFTLYGGQAVKLLALNLHHYHTAYV